MDDHLLEGNCILRQARENEREGDDGDGRFIRSHLE
jgi:hypothetical protein